MYKNVIEIRKDVPGEVLKKLSCIADRAFDNRAGKVSNVSDFPYCFIYEGGEDAYACLEVGMMELWDVYQFMSCVNSWQWVDEEEPGESCDVLKVLAEPVR